MVPQPGLQLRTLTLYGELLCRSGNWAHKLTLAAFEGASDTGLAAASTLAGAASLTIDPESALVKAHFRDGAFDFVVHTLDEALRTLKNEIRQGRPIAIALTAQPDEALAEAAERGLAADLILCSEKQMMLGYADVFHPQTQLLPYGNDPSPELEQWLAARDWRTCELPPAFMAFSDTIRRRWLQNLPTLQRSSQSRDRFVWATLEEIAALTPPR